LKISRVCGCLMDLHIALCTYIHRHGFRPRDRPGDEIIQRTMPSAATLKRRRSEVKRSRGHVVRISRLFCHPRYLYIYIYIYICHVCVCEGVQVLCARTHTCIYMLPVSSVQSSIQKKYYMCCIDYAYIVIIVPFFFFFVCHTRHHLLLIYTYCHNHPRTAKCDEG